MISDILLPLQLRTKNPCDRITSGKKTSQAMWEKRIKCIFPFLIMTDILFGV